MILTNNPTQNMNTEYINLTEMWQDGEYADVARIINEEHWSRAEVAEFCAYFNKYLGSDQLNVLYKFL
tara:strand:+ start:76 stop:279 length:204 start_codon:yes stop_codon:yes gene_type:complete